MALQEKKKLIQQSGWGGGLMLYRSLRAHLGVKLPSPDRDNKTNLTTPGRFLATGGHECYLIVASCIFYANTIIYYVCIWLYLCLFCSI